MFVPVSNTLVAGRYELIDEIGRGGMGVVWRARQTNLGVECAVKFIHAAQAHEPEVRRRFVREARAAASLKSPNSVHILDVDEWQGTLFIAMELLGGESLEARLERETALSPRLTLEIVEQVARGLNKAHAMRLVHRDLKPENIFLLDDEPLLVKILDFGIAKRFDASSGLSTTSGVLVGTPGYMSPEQADGGKEIDYRSDLWSLAVVAFRCLTGFAPFDGDGLGQVLVKVMTGPIPAPCTLRPSLPSRVDDWWFRVLQRDPAQRPPSALALASSLRDALAGALEPPAELGLLRVSSVESLQPTERPASGRPTRRMRPWRRYAVAGAVLAGGGVLVTGPLVAERWLSAMNRGASEPSEARWPLGEAPPARETRALAASVLTRSEDRSSERASAMAPAPADSTSAPGEARPVTVAPRVAPSDAAPLASSPTTAVEAERAPVPVRPAQPPRAVVPGPAAASAREIAEREAGAPRPVDARPVRPRAGERAAAEPKLQEPTASAAEPAAPAEPGPAPPGPADSEPPGEERARSEPSEDGPSDEAPSDEAPPPADSARPDPDVFRKPPASRGAPADDPRLGF